MAALNWNIYTDSRARLYWKWKPFEKWKKKKDPWWMPRAVWMPLCMRLAVGSLVCGSRLFHTCDTNIKNSVWHTARNVSIIIVRFWFSFNSICYIRCHVCSPFKTIFLNDTNRSAEKSIEKFHSDGEFVNVVFLSPFTLRWMPCAFCRLLVGHDIGLRVAAHDGLHFHHYI